MKYRFLIFPLFSLSFLMPVQGDQTLTLKKDSLEVDLDPVFPRVIAYRTPAGSIAGQTTRATAVLLNGKPVQYGITRTRKSADSMGYHINFPAEKITMELAVTVGSNVVDLKVAKLDEAGPVKVKTIAFPGNSLLAVSTAQPDAAIAACLATNTNDQFGTTFRERISPVASLKSGDKDTGNYFFLSSGNLAAGIGCGNFTDIQRTSWNIGEINGIKTCTAQNPVWEFRMFDDEKPALPWVKVFVTPDINDDGKADWQDAAIVCRRVMPKPFGHELVKSTVGENIAMNFASGAQQPFLKILDEVKKIYLATDGIGNQVVIKGFSSEGHDSANTDYAGNWNERAGGLKDFTTLLDHAHTYNSRIGIHINASEAYPEAKRYQPEILRRDAKGNLKGGWSWLDHANMIDKVADVRSGRLFSALEQMRKDLPKLDCVYVDTYWENGWPAAKTAEKINSLGLPMYSEGDSCLDPWIVWGHWRGTKHTIQRFLWFSDRDLFANDAILRAGRADTDGFMGWQNQHQFKNFIRSTFTQHLPAKFLQHFELLRWEPGKSAVFSDGVRVEKSGDAVTVTQQGRPLMSWTGAGADSRLLVPWPPAKPEKCYLWSDGDAALSWELPLVWKSAANVYLYQLTDLGRTGETLVSVIDGRIAPKLEKGVPYVIYQTKAPQQKPVIFGEGSPVKDPGFDSRSFASWKLEGTGNIESDANGNPRLVMPAGEAAVSQAITGIKPGKTYAATVWAQTTGNRTATIEVSCDGKIVSNYVTLCNVRHSAPNDPRTGTNYQRLRVVFTRPEDSAPYLDEVEALGKSFKGKNGGVSTSASIKLKGGAGEGVVEFDEIRVVETRVSPEAGKHFFWEDFENVETGGYGPFTNCPGERTHLSESNPPHTHDTIHGRYSLKSRDGGCVGRSLPSTLRLKPGTKYRVTCQTIGNGRLTATSMGKTVMELRFPNNPNNGVAPVTGGFVTRADTESYLSLFRDGGDFIAIDDLAIDEVGPATAEDLAAFAVTVPAIADEKIPGMKVLYEEKFDKALRKEWTFKRSGLPGTSIEARDGALSINAYANISICSDLSPLPKGVTAVETRLTVDGDCGQTWGPGLALVWPDGNQLRVNLRSPDGKFGIDSTAATQSITGNFTGGTAILRIRIEEKSIIAEARCAEDKTWQKLAGFSREKFAGDPVTLRLGKTHGVEALDDHGDLGAISTTNYSLLRIYGK